MQRSTRVVGRTGVGALAILIVAACSLSAETRAATAACTFRQQGTLPDRKCTPGAANRHVTQSNIATTICKRGWTATVRPPESVTEPAKFKAMTAYGIPITRGHAGLYEFDHLIPLELGGDPGWAYDSGSKKWVPTSTHNLWPEPHDVMVNGQEFGSYTKDTVENRLNAEVCSGKITLAAARREIRKNWTTAS